MICANPRFAFADLLTNLARSLVLKVRGQDNCPLLAGQAALYHPRLGLVAGAVVGKGIGV